MSQLADWKCHKVVKAGKVIGQPVHDESEQEVRVLVEDVNGAPCSVMMDAKAFARGVPSAGDYIVIYEDGYKSWSPAKAFEEGYSRMVTVDT